MKFLCKLLNCGDRQFQLVVFNNKLRVSTLISKSDKFLSKILFDSTVGRTVKKADIDVSFD